MAGRIQDSPREYKFTRQSLKAPWLYLNRWPHLVQVYLDTALGRLPGSLAPRQSTTYDGEIHLRTILRYSQYTAIECSQGILVSVSPLNIGSAGAVCSTTDCTYITVLGNVD